MAGNLAKIFGTEDDKVNCSFYFKIGCCRHGNGCSRTHVKPTFSQTLLFPHLYIPPGSDSKAEIAEHYEDFYEEILEECMKFGRVVNITCVENLGEHMIGNVFVKFEDEEDCQKALAGLAGRFYAGRLVNAEYSPVTDFREGRCRQFEEDNCKRGGYCNFMHLKSTPRWARKILSKARDQSFGTVNGRKKRSRETDRGQRRGYRRFPIRGTSEERRKCISQWNRERNRRLTEIERIQERGRGTTESSRTRSKKSTLPIFPGDLLQNQAEQTHGVRGSYRESLKKREP